MRLTAVIVVAVLCGCATERSFKLIDATDAKRAAWADPKTTFQPSESFVVHIRGYGGRKVTLELWHCGTHSQTMLHQRTHDIPARKMYRSYDPLVWDTQWFREVGMAEQETFYWTSTDYFLRFKPLPPGAYELRLRSYDGRNESVKFTVAAYK